MKYSINSCFVALIVFFSFLSITEAQIILESNDLPDLGDIIYVGSTVESSFDIGNADTNQVWNYDYLVPDAIDTISFISIAGTSAELTFQNSEMAVEGSFSDILGFDIGALAGVDPPDATIYISHDNQGHLEIDGINTSLDLGIIDLGEQNLISADPILMYAHLEYGDSIQGTGNFDLPIDLDSIELTLRLNFDRKIVSDAWGNITTPLGSWDCIRQREETTIIPEIGTLFGPVFIPIPGIIPDSLSTTSIAYNFFANGMDYPILRASDNGLGAYSLQYQADPTDLPPPVVSFEYESNCLVFTFTNNTSFADSYLWDFGDGTTSLLPEPNYVYDEEGNYTISLTASNGVDTVTVEQMVFADDCVTDISDNDLNNKLKVYQSGNKVLINCNNTNDIFFTRLIDINGKLLRSFYINNTETVLDLNTYNTGIYVILVNDKSGQSFYKTLIRF